MNQLTSKPLELLQALNRFSQSFKGNPQEMIQNAVNSGKLTQTQLNQAQQMAYQIQNMLKQIR